MEEPGSHRIAWLTEYMQSKLVALRFFLGAISPHTWATTWSTAALVAVNELLHDIKPPLATMGHIRRSRPSEGLSRSEPPCYS